MKAVGRQQESALLSALLKRGGGGAIYSLIEQHVGHSVLDGEAPPRLGAHQRALDQRHLQQHAVKRLQEGVVLQLLLGGRRLGEPRRLGAELRSEGESGRA